MSNKKNAENRVGVSITDEDGGNVEVNTTGEDGKNMEVNATGKNMKVRVTIGGDLPTKQKLPTPKTLPEVPFIANLWARVKSVLNEGVTIASYKGYKLIFKIEKIKQGSIIFDLIVEIDSLDCTHDNISILWSPVGESKIAPMDAIEYCWNIRNDIPTVVMDQEKSDFIKEYLAIHPKVSETINKAITELLKIHEGYVLFEADTKEEKFSMEISWNESKKIKIYKETISKKGNLGNFQDAIHDYDNAIQLNNYGVAKMNLGNFKDAIRDYDNAIQLNPKYSDAYYNRGVAKMNLGNFKDAIHDYNNAIQLNPKYSDAYYNRGIAKNRLGDIKSAASDYAKAKEINPKLELKGFPSDNSNK